MDASISQFLTPGAVALAVAITALTFFVRRIVETAVPAIKKMADENDPKPTYASALARWWNQVVLYLIPVALGSGLGWLHVPYLFDLPGLADTNSRVFFGGVVGWLSSLIYKGIKVAIKKKTGIDIEPNSASIPGAPSLPPGPPKAEE